jgi:hypothetical protein
MAFNHYAKMKRILAEYQGWYIVRIDEPTSSQSFKGEVRHFDHYYRVFDANDTPIKFCKFQQIERFASSMGVEVEALPIVITL